MNADKTLTNPTTKNDTDMKISDELLKQTCEIMQVLFDEYCEQEGIDESELKNRLQIVRCDLDTSLHIVNVDDERDEKLSITFDTMDGKVVFHVIVDAERFPKTDKYLKELHNGL